MRKLVKSKSNLYSSKRSPIKLQRNTFIDHQNSNENLYFDPNLLKIDRIDFNLNKIKNFKFHMRSQTRAMINQEFNSHKNQFLFSSQEQFKKSMDPLDQNLLKILFVKRHLLLRKNINSKLIQRSRILNDADRRDNLKNIFIPSLQILNKTLYTFRNQD